MIKQRRSLGSINSISIASDNDYNVLKTILQLILLNFNTRRDKSRDTEIQVNFKSIRYQMELSTENLDIRAGLEADVVVHPVQGNPNQEFHVEVSLEPAEKVQIVGIYKGDDGNFHVKFIPVVPGTYDIFIDGEKLVDSHFTVQAKERQMDVISKLELKGEIPQQPIGIAVNSQGLIAVADIHKHCIFIFGEKGDFLRTLGCYGKKPGQLSSPVGVTFLNDDEILVADALNHRVQQFNVKIGRCKDFAPK